MGMSTWLTPGLQPVVMVTVTVEAAALMLTQGQAADGGGDPCGAPRAAAQRKRSAKPSKVVIVVVGVGWCRVVGWFEFDCSPRAALNLWHFGARVTSAALRVVSSQLLSCTHCEFETWFVPKFVDKKRVSNFRSQSKRCCFPG